MPRKSVRFLQEMLPIISQNDREFAMLNVGRWFNADVSARRRTNQRRRLASGRMRLTSLRPNSCFIVDNDTAARHAVVNALEGRGAACTELASADEPFAELNKFAPSMIFLDISLRDS